MKASHRNMVSLANGYFWAKQMPKISSGWPTKTCCSDHEPTSLQETYKIHKKLYILDRHRILEPWLQNQPGRKDLHPLSHLLSLLSTNQGVHWLECEILPKISCVWTFGPSWWLGTRCLGRALRGEWPNEMINWRRPWDFIGQPHFMFSLHWGV